MGKRVRNVPTIADLDARFRVMDEFGEYCQFLTLPAPPMETMAAPDKSPEFARIANDGLAELVAKYPDRFIGFAASLPMNNVDACLKEIDRSVTQLGARGFQIYTNVAGKPLDLPEFCAHLRRSRAPRSYHLDAPGARRRFSRLSDRRPNRSTKSGGLSAGPTKPAPPCRASCSRACSIGIPISGSSPITWVA